MHTRSTSPTVAASRTTPPPGRDDGHTPTRNSLSDDVKTSSSALLNQILADLTDLASQCKQAHWNVKGPGFMWMHQFFDSLAAVATKRIDDLAERLVAIGGHAQGTVRNAASASRLPELDPTDTYLTQLEDRFALLANFVRPSIDTAAQSGDANTVDLLTNLSRDLDKALWMLEAHRPK